MALSIAAGEWTGYYNGEQIDGIESFEPDLENEFIDLAGIDRVRRKVRGNRGVGGTLTLFDVGTDNVKKLLGDAFVAAGAAVAGQEGVEVKEGTAGAIVLGGTGLTQVALEAPFQLVPADSPDEGTVTFFDAVATLVNATYEDAVLKLQVRIESRATGVQVMKGAVTFDS